MMEVNALRTTSFSGGYDCSIIVHYSTRLWWQPLMRDCEVSNLTSRECINDYYRNLRTIFFSMVEKM